MEKERIFTIETTKDNLYKSYFKQNEKQMYELDNGMIIGFSSYGINCYAPDENGIYGFVGDIQFSQEGSTTEIFMHSLGISNMRLNNGDPLEMKVNGSNLKHISIEIDNRKAKELPIRTNNFFDF
ncbi:hypothetical protein CNQ87_15240 [Lysinibacillus fusiformis]|uniref:hypothetical protein n=1 Tax=Lysinibacillus fusiformis TaxID=28031 RepID=UPI000BBA84D4|nr:hypothetical protein [Lysinibacillus fusiformis]PCD81963.1 hypothetical protein CNQ87_15240 [Lysinibacillus fusiformis]